MASAATMPLEPPLSDHEANGDGETSNAMNGGTLFGDEDEEDDDDDDDVVTKNKRRPTSQPQNSILENGEDEESDLPDIDDDGDKGLFGDDEDEEAPQPTRKLDDSELDSGDDHSRGDRAASRSPSPSQQAAGNFQEEELTMMPVRIPRAPLPATPGDEQLYLLKVPKFLSIDPSPYDRSTFQPPKADHHGKTQHQQSSTPGLSFNPRTVARTTIRHRKRDASLPHKSSNIASNTRILRWSDGSLTLQIASDPGVQYPLPAQPLAPPPSFNPTKPVPTALKPGVPAPRHYNPNQESYTYLAVPLPSAQVMRVTHKLTATLNVQASKSADDEAVQRLKARMAASRAGGTTLSAAEVTEDPEMVKRKAELAEKEREKAARKRENQEMRERERAERRAMGIRGTGLTVGSLEDEEGGRRAGLGAGGKRSGGPRVGGKKKAKRPSNRRGEILSDEEEEYGRRVRTKEDEYDEEDDFVAPSDDEEEVGGEGDEEEEEEEEEEDEGDEGDRGGQESRPPPRRSSPAKRRATADEGEGGPSTNSPVARNKRRRIVDDDDED